MVPVLDASDAIALDPSGQDAWVSMRHVQRAVTYMNAAGMDVGGVLSLGGLSLAQLGDVDRKVPLTAIEAMLEADAWRDDPLLGLHVAQEIQPGTLGTLGYVLQACNTLGELLEVVVRFNGLLSNIGHTSVNHSPESVEVRWDCRAGGEVLRRQAHEYILGVFSVMRRLLAPDSHGPLAVQFPHEAPERPEHLAAHLDFFGCPVHFGRPHAAITLSALDMQVRLPHGDAELKALLERHALHLLSRRRVGPAGAGQAPSAFGGTPGH